MRDGEVSSRAHRGRAPASKRGCSFASRASTTPIAAQGYVGALLYAPREQVALADGEYLDDDLVGCAVCGADGTHYGNVERVEHYPASDMLVVDGRMVPMVAAIVTRSTLICAERRIVIDPPEGLLDYRSS